MSRDFFEFDERGRGLDRTISFSDGVFAIAITLLVLNSRLPHVVGSHDQSRQLFDGLRRDSGVLVGFVLSFYVIARYWCAHHRLSLILKTVDNRFISLNLIFLAVIVFLPYPTEIVGLYGNTTTAVVLYASTLVLVSATSVALWQHAFKAGLLDQRPVGLRRQIWSRSVVPTVVFGLSIPVAFLTPSAAKDIWLLLLTSPLVVPILEGERKLRGSARPS